MATLLEKPLYVGQLPAVAAELYKPAAGKTAIITTIRIVNTDSVNRTCRLFVDPTNSSNFVNATRITSIYSLAADGSVLLSPGDGTPITLDENAQLGGVASAAAQVTCAVFGVEITL